MHPKIVFDIETIGKDFDSFDDVSKEYLLAFAQDEEEKQETKDRLGFYPLTGEIVAIGIFNPQTEHGIVLSAGKSKKKLPQKLDDDITLETGDERFIIERFWELAKSYHHFISFNGRQFDVPFLMIRSAILGIHPSKNLLTNKYLNYQPDNAKHIDLYDQLTFYGAMRKKFNLHMWTKAFGIESPKEQGVTGNDVQKLFKKGDIETIARYNSRDLRSTAQLYNYWKEYLE